MVGEIAIQIIQVARDVSIVIACALYIGQCLK